MAPTSSETIVRDLLHAAGIEVNGTNPWDIQVLDRRFFERLLREPHLTMGEGYMLGWWECEAIDQLVARIVLARLDERVAGQLEGRAARPPVQAVQPADVRPGLRGRQTPLRPRQRPVPRHAGPAALLHLRLLEERHDARRGAGSQARPGVQEDRRRPRHAHPRAGLRLGQLRQIRRRTVRRAGAGRDRLRKNRWRSGWNCARGCPSSCACRTTARWRAPTMPSFPSASWSTSATRTTAPTWRWPAAA